MMLCGFALFNHLMDCVVFFIILWLGVIIFYFIIKSNYLVFFANNFLWFDVQIVVLIVTIMTYMQYIVVDVLMSWCLLIIFFLLQIINNPCTDILTAHFRLEGKGSHVNLLKKVIQTTKQSYLFYEPSRVRILLNYWIKLIN